MADSFDGTTIYVRAYSVPADYDSDISEHHIPGGDITYWDLGGSRDGRLNMRLRFATLAAFETLLAKRQTQGTLVYERGTFTAILKRLRQTEIYPSGKNLAEAEFVITS